ncbi:MAG: ABC-2 type transport system ATP-binding protein [Planctomycetaceae bacterium]|jgi:ABC-2 type transport system ATP-binding protein
MSESVIDIKGVSRSFGKKIALDEVDLSVPQGSVVGLVGENGAGKTTLLKHVLGLFRAKTGSVRVFGKDPVEDPEAVLGEIGYLSEVRDLPDWMKIGELMSYTRAFFPSWDDAFAEELREMFELSLDQKVKTLSRGQRARAGLIAAIAHRPQLLVLDEPSSGLDPVVRRDILSAIIRTVADEGRTVLFSSHLLDEVQRVSDHVAMLHLGKMLLTSPMDDVLTSHHRLTVRFEQPLDSPLKIDAALRCEGEGREWTVLCNGERASVEAKLAQLSGEIVDRAAPTLDEIFVARMNK